MLPIELETGVVCHIVGIVKDSSRTMCALIKSTSNNYCIHDQVITPLVHMQRAITRFYSCCTSTMYSFSDKQLPVLLDTHVGTCVQNYSTNENEEITTIYA